MFTLGGLELSYTNAFGHFAIAASALNELQRINFVLCVSSEWNRGKGVLCSIFI